MIKTPIYDDLQKYVAKALTHVQEEEHNLIIAEATEKFIATKIRNVTQKVLDLLESEKWYPAGKGTSMDDVKTAEILNDILDKVKRTLEELDITNVKDFNSND